MPAIYLHPHSSALGSLRSPSGLSPPAVDRSGEGSWGRIVGRRQRPSLVRGRCRKIQLSEGSQVSAAKRSPERRGPSCAGLSSRERLCKLAGCSLLHVRGSFKVKGLRVGLRCGSANPAPATL